MQGPGRFMTNSLVKTSFWQWQRGQKLMLCRSKKFSITSNALTLTLAKYYQKNFRSCQEIGLDLSWKRILQQDICGGQMQAKMEVETWSKCSTTTSFRTHQCLEPLELESSSSRHTHLLIFRLVWPVLGSFTKKVFLKMLRASLQSNWSVPKIYSSIE